MQTNWLEGLLLQIKNLWSPRSRKWKGKLYGAVTVGASSQVGERGASCLDTPGTGSFLCSPLLYDLECFLGYSLLRMGVPIMSNLKSPTRLRLQCHTQCATGEVWRSLSFLVQLQKILPSGLQALRLDAYCHLASIPSRSQNRAGGWLPQIRALFLLRTKQSKNIFFDLKRHFPKVLCWDRSHTLCFLSLFFGGSITELSYTSQRNWRRGFFPP